MTPRPEDQQTNAHGRARGADAANSDAVESQSAVSQQDEADSVCVRVLFFGAARDAATDEAVLSLARASTAPCSRCAAGSSHTAPWSRSRWRRRSGWC